MVAGLADVALSSAWLVDAFQMALLMEVRFRLHALNRDSSVLVDLSSWGGRGPWLISNHGLMLGRRFTWPALERALGIGPSVLRVVAVGWEGTSAGSELVVHLEEEGSRHSPRVRWGGRTIPNVW